LRTGSYHVLFAEGTVYVFARKLGDEELIVAINVGTAPADHVSFEVVGLQSQPNQQLYGTAEVSWSGEGESNHLSLHLAPRSGCILG
jgi:hypothetical protein